MNKYNFKDKANKVHNYFYNYSESIYNGSDKDMTIICPIHGRFTQTPNKHINQGHNCPKCVGRGLTTEEIREKLRQKFGDKYNFSQFEYKNAIEKSVVICNEHGAFEANWHKLNDGHGCPICGSMNISEMRLKKLLEKHFDDVAYQKKFEWLGKQSLDFYLPKYNIGVEYQGRQHFCIQTRFDYEDTLERDLRKLSICNEHNVKMLYFTYEKSKIPKDFNYYKIYTDEDEFIKEIADSNK